MTVVIDCNIWVMAVSSNSPYHKLVNHLANGNFHLLVTNDILLEYEEVLSSKYDHDTCLRFLLFLYEINFVVFKEAYYNWNLIHIDPDDNKYCDCYIAGAADYLVTQDKHFKVLADIQFPKINVITIDDFLAILNNL
jgi:putative PIN family toxin of toxin-antitoxin system